MSAHVLRHTAITNVARLAGYATAQAFAGHTPPTVTGRYIHATLAEVAAVVAVLTGEPHPFAAALLVDWAPVDPALGPGPDPAPTAAARSSRAHRSVDAVATAAGEHHLEPRSGRLQSRMAWRHIGLGQRPGYGGYNQDTISSGTGRHLGSVLPLLARWLRGPSNR
ncbi:MAG: hypothetical protein ACR2HP_00075 [Ilumatobacteraceae bacterium]